MTSTQKAETARSHVPTEKAPHRYAISATGADTRNRQMASARR